MPDTIVALNSFWKHCLFMNVVLHILQINKIPSFQASIAHLFSENFGATIYNSSSTLYWNCRIRACK